MILSTSIILIITRYGNTVGDTSQPVDPIVASVEDRKCTKKSYTCYSIWKWESMNYKQHQLQQFQSPQSPGQPLLRKGKIILILVSLLTTLIFAYTIFRLGTGGSQANADSQCLSSGQQFNGRQEAMGMASQAEQYRSSHAFNGNYGYEDIGFGQRLFADAVALEYQFQRVETNVAIVRTAPIIRLLINNRINIIPLSYGGGDRSRYVILPQMSCQTFLLHMPLMIRQKSQQKNQVSHYVLFAKKSKPVLMHL